MIEKKSAEIAKKLLAKACDLAVSPAEAQVFAKGFSDQLRKNGLTFDDLSFERADDVISLAREVARLQSVEKAMAKEIRSVKAERDAVLAEFAALEEEHRALEQEHSELKANYAHLQSQHENQTAAAVKPDPKEMEYVSYAEFEEMGTAIFGHGPWKPNFAFQAKIPNKEMNAWKVVGIVPAAYLAQLDTLTRISHARWCIGASDRVKLVL